MKKILFFLSFCVCVVAACSQQDTAGHCLVTPGQISLTVGQSVVSLQQFRPAGSGGFLLLQLHSNERSAGEAAYTAACRWGTEFLQLLNNEQRLVGFQHQEQWFQFDPNRIFSTEGIRKTLAQSGAISEGAVAAVQQFSDSLLCLLNRYQVIIAVHNNTDSRFNIRQYLPIDPERVHLNQQQDEDDFFLTNDPAFFAALKAGHHNVVWENASRMEEDGSLSLYCQRNNIRYINIEAEHGHTAGQLAMLETVKRILEEEKKL